MGRSVRVFGSAVTAVALAMLLVACSGSDDDSAHPDAKVPVVLALETDNRGFDEAAEAAVDSGSGAPSYLTLSEIASRYGASQDVVDSAVKELADQGVDVKADPTNSVLWGEVDVSTAEQLFDVTFETQKSDTGVQTIRADEAPTVPADLKGVTAVAGLAATMPDEGGDSSGNSSSSTTTSANSSTTAPLPVCPGGEVTRASLAGMYGFDELVDTGVTGEGVTLAMLEIESFDPRVFETYDGCVPGALDAERVSETGVELSPPPAPGSEVALDTVAIGLLAPGVQQRITRFDPESSIVFPLLSVLDSSSQGATPEALLSTVGFCEDVLSDAEVAIGERLLATFALTGTTTVASSGDIGSSSCHPGTADPAVQYPSSSAWVSAVGGASFGGSATQPTDLAVWNSTPDADNAAGGGVSTKVDRPTWQAGTGQDGDKRAVPDLSAFATPGGVGLVPTCTADSCEWQALGGTSLSGAAVAGGLALMLEPSAGTDTARRVGHLAPIVHAAGTDAAVDITSGDNQVFTEQCCSAGAGYDLASGWGLLDLTGLVGRPAGNG